MNKSINSGDPIPEKIFIRDLNEKDVFKTCFLTKDKLVSFDRNGKPFLSANLIDSTGTINGRLFENVEETSESFESGDFVLVKGHVQIFQGRKQVVIHSLVSVDQSQIHLPDYFSGPIKDPEEVFGRVLGFVESMSNTYVRQLTLSALTNPEIKERLLLAPAAKSIHHAYIGGLLDHVLGICGIMEFMAKHYPELNQDLLVFGAIFHDLGKVKELSVKNGIHYTNEGRLVGHMAIACEFIDQGAAQIPDFPDELKFVLKHIILSHHGKLEYGSPKRPKFPEAFVVAMIDDLDSKLNTMFGFMNGEQEGSQEWTRYHSGFDRYFYLDIPAVMKK